MTTMNDNKDIEISTNPEDWELLVSETERLLEEAEKNFWARADIAHEAAQKFGRLKELCDRLNLTYTYWKTLSSVGGRYSHEERIQFPSLGFRFFAVVVHRADRMELLRLAEDEHWSVRRLQEEVKYRNAQLEPRVVKGPPGRIDPTVGMDVVDEGETYATEIENFRLSYDDMVEALNWMWQNRREEMQKAVRITDVLKILYAEQRNIEFNDEDGFYLEINTLAE